MVVIRLARGGAKKSPFYQVVAADKRRARDSRFIERLGYFNPIARGSAVALDLNQERVDYWISQGAQPSERVAKLIKEFKKSGVQKATAASKSVQRKEQSELSETAHAAAQAKKLADEAQSSASENNAAETSAE